MMKISQADLARAFTEWDRQCRNNPEGFDSVVEHLLRNTPDTYGNRCAVYFQELLKDTKV